MNFKLKSKANVKPKQTLSTLTPTFNSSPEKTGDIVIDLLDVNEFTDDHATTAWNLLPWVKIYPELYGEGLPKEIIFDKFMILPHDAVNYSQKYRAGGRSTNNKIDEIKQNIERNGYKLKYPPAAWFYWSPDKYEVITGNTRGEIVKGPPFNMPNMIVAIYKASSLEYSEEQIQDALECCGLRFNAIHDPAAPLSKEDVVRVVTLQVVRWNRTNGKAGCAPTIDAIAERVDLVCGEGVFQPNTRLSLIYQIYNDFSPHSRVISWGVAKEAAWRVSTFLKEIKWVNTDKVIYLPISASTISQAYAKAVALAVKHPDKEIRIVLHTGTLSGYNLFGSYKERLRTAVSKFDIIVRNSCQALFGVTIPKYKRIKLYGALPALEASHSINEGFYYDENTDSFYQRVSGLKFDLDGGTTSHSTVSDDDEDEEE